MATGICASFSKSKRNWFIASTILLAIIAVTSIYLLLSNSILVIFDLIRIYPFSSLFIALFAVTMLLVNILSYAYSKDYLNLLFLLSLSFAGAFIVATAISILSILIGLEMLAITTAFAMLFEGKHRIEAAVKFFILSSISVAILTFALALLIPFNSQLTLTPAIQNANLSGTALILLSMALFAVAFGFDTALFPFNLWVPDVYQGAPTYVTSMLSGVNKKVAFVALIEVFFFVFLAYKSTFSLIFVILAIFTMFFGNLAAFVQKNVKRLFAYSSISQAGYILVGIATVTQFGLEASIFYIIAHAFMIIGAFAIIMWLESKNIKTIDEYGALNSKNTFAAASLTILMLSMAGIPPLIGFAGKFLLFSSAISSGMVILAGVGILNSFISIYYYAKIMSSMYSKKQAKALKMDHYIMAVVIIALVVVIVFGIYPQPLINIAAIASKAVLGI
jgi:NADH-quinone oxidoreductase subunit N